MVNKCYLAAVVLVPLLGLFTGYVGKFFFAEWITLYGPVLRLVLLPKSSRKITDVPS